MGKCPHCAIAPHRSGSPRWHSPPPCKTARNILFCCPVAFILASLSGFRGAAAHGLKKLAGCYQAIHYHQTIQQTEIARPALAIEIPWLEGQATKQAKGAIQNMRQTQTRTTHSHAKRCLEKSPQMRKLIQVDLSTIHSHGHRLGRLHRCTQKVRKDVGICLRALEPEAILGPDRKQERQQHTNPERDT